MERETIPDCDVAFRLQEIAKDRVYAKRERDANDKREQEALENARWEDGRIRSPKH
jgi:hypothetical protein